MKILTPRSAVMDHQIPDMIEEAGAWVGPKIQQDESWIYRLSDDDVAEIDAALKHLSSSGINIPFTPDQFPLPKLVDRLDLILDDLENRLGLALIRGLPRQRFSDHAISK